MKIIYLWGSSDIPTPNKWVEFNPIHATYVDDEGIASFNEKILHPYYNIGIRKTMYFVLTESSFFTMSYIDRVEDGIYYLKSMVRIKYPEDLDYEVEIISDEEEYAERVSKYTEKVEYGEDIIVTEHTTTDSSVELLYYPKEILNVIEVL